MELVDKKLEYSCAGSLINPSVVLTSAHNFIGKNIEIFTLRAGEWDSSSGDEPLEYQDNQIDKIVYNDFEVKTGANDIALIFLKKPFFISANVRTVCLPNEDETFANIDWYKNRLT